MKSYELINIYLLLIRKIMQITYRSLHAAPNAAVISQTDYLWI